METVKGYVEHIVYRNAENGYSVITLSADSEEVTCVGILPLLTEGEYIEADGNYTVHASYGEQFRVETYREITPEDAPAIERYLGSGAVKGIGKALAGRIVKKFGKDTFRIMEEEPERLAEVKGISMNKARVISAQVEGRKDMRDAMVYLARLGISSALSVKIYKRYGNEIYRVLKENPYRLADDIEGVGFHIADEIAQRAGIEADSDFRVRSGILYVLSRASAEGHIYLPKDVLIQWTEELLGTQIAGMDAYLSDLSIDRKIVAKEEENEVRVYTNGAYCMELDTAYMIHELNISGAIREDKIREKVHGFEEQMHLQLDEMQMQAVIESARHAVLVLTGGPGTGKTTTINIMIRYFESEGLNIALAAPTGRAAKRMAEATGREAKTLHRLLEVQGQAAGRSGMFQRNRDNPLDADVIIVDEMSMVDIYLMHALLSAVTVGTRLVLLGDAYQLPSVGPGCVLKDIINSETCTVIRLSKIFRQAEESDIIVNAHKIKEGRYPVLDNRSRDFFFLKRDNVDDILAVTIKLVRDSMPAYVHADQKDIQVLTPTRKGLTGVERLNGILQQYLNPAAPGKHEIHAGNTIFREGDKVMQIHNNYQVEWEVRGRYGIPVEKGNGVFNGDCGTIREINDYDGIVSVEFDERRVVDYPTAELEQLQLAYAVTIHKSQGSEYPAVVIPLIPGPRMLMNRNLIYTAITRAKSCVVMVGSPEVLKQMIDNTSEQRRYTTLALRLKQAEAGDKNEMNSASGRTPE